MTRVGQRAILRFLVVLTALRAVSAPAQAPAYTLGDVVTRLQAAATIVNFAVANPAVYGQLDSLAAFFADVHAKTLTLDEVADIFTRRTATFGTVARWNRDACAPSATPCFYSALVGLSRIAHGSLERSLQTQLSRDSLNSLYRPIDELGTKILKRAQAANQEKLRRYEVKYGPSSPQLNLAEVGLNYVAQLFVPALLPSPDGWPTPYELVASYRPTDLTAAQSSTGHLTGRAVSATQLGVRVYNFAATCGKGRWAELLNPCYSSGGALLIAPKDAPLLRTWGTDTRAGVYLARGTYHLGYVFGSNQRVVFGVGTQIVPYVF